MSSYMDDYNMLPGDPPQDQRGDHEYRERGPGYYPGYYNYPPYYQGPAPYPYYPTTTPYYPAPTGACPIGTTPYTVQAGDTLYSIAARFNVPTGRIVANNPSVNFSLPLPVGQPLCI